MSVVGLQACDGAHLMSFIDAVIMQVGVSRTGGKRAIRTFFRILEKFEKMGRFTNDK